PSRVLSPPCCRRLRRRLLSFRPLHRAGLSLSPYTTLFRSRTDKCASCTHLCPHRIALEGMDGKSGRIGNSGLPTDYRGITLENRSEEHTSELQSRFDLVCRLLLEKKNNTNRADHDTSQKHT